MTLHGAWLSWHHIRFREVVRIGDPADVVGEGDVAVCEVCRRPAVYRRSNVLRSADDDREDDQQNDRVAVTQTVGQIVVVTHVRLDDLRRSFEDAFEHHDRVGDRLHQRRVQPRLRYPAQFIQCTKNFIGSCRER